MSSYRTLGLLCLIAVGLGLFFALRTPPAPSTAEAQAKADTVEREEDRATLEPTPDPRAVVVPANLGPKTAPAPPVTTPAVTTPASGGAFVPSTAPAALIVPPISEFRLSD